MSPADASATALLKSWRDGDRAALDALLPVLYAELSRIARGAMRGERRDHTLQTRALVHEAYLRLVDADIPYQDRAHFLALAARTMRRILSNHARDRRRDKRGGKRVRVGLTDLEPAAPERGIDCLALDEALTRLAAQDERKAQVIEMHFYAGMSYEEMADALGVSRVTVNRDLRLARAWLQRELKRIDA